MTFDPFADTDADEAQTDLPSTGPWEEPAEVQIPSPRAPMDNGHKVRVTLKGGSGYEDPWITVDGADVADAADQLSDGPSVDKLVKLTSTVARHFHKTYGAGKPATQAGGARQAGKPTGADEAPGGEKRYCEHGQMKFMSGVSKSSGKPYKGFFCTAADRAEQCKPQFLK
ncbi:hypothetical protein [Actinokineospora enzanensis]|uniref:hypothetical protein n=1 Tax=Actinokineospora enzanensis TaxID=155975 RepID=UPI0003622FF4|nr:hypothetical protein [Actinokineospora enzanensis]